MKKNEKIIMKLEQQLINDVYDYYTKNAKVYYTKRNIRKIYLQKSVAREWKVFILSIKMFKTFILKTILMSTVLMLAFKHNLFHQPFSIS